MRGWFVTGTDTGVGKTVVAVSLLHALRQSGIPAIGVKPVAAGCMHTAGGWRNDDALALQAASARAIAYSDVNPVALPAPASPHLAAAEAGIEIDCSRLIRHVQGLATADECLVVEGAGGWRVPLSSGHTMADLAAGLGLPVVLVVAIRLGCLNHAVLSSEAIVGDGLRLAGWVAVQTEADVPRLDEQIATLDARLPGPRFGTIPWQGLSFSGDACNRLDVSVLLAGG